MQHKLFKDTSSTKLEIQTFLWALEEVKKNYPLSLLYNNLVFYTDSQCIVGLLSRRDKLEQSSYRNKGSDKRHNHSELYEQFYYNYDNLSFEIIQLKGHSKFYLKDKIHQIFTLVDKDSRKALKDYFKK